MKKKITQNVNKDNLFNDLPEVHPEKSKWLSRHTNYQACNAASIVPIYYDEVLPGEKRKVTLGMISHTETPIAPIFNAMYTEIRSFFVPMRLCADLLNGYRTRKSPWVKVFGEDNASYNATQIVSLADQKLPDITSQMKTNLANSFAAVGSSDNVFDSLDLVNASDGLASSNILNLAAYELIYQKHYRNENYEAATYSGLYKLIIDAYNSTSSNTLSGFTFEKANREKDYFTGAKPYTLKASSPVSVPLGTSAQVVIKNNSSTDAMNEGGAFKLGQSVAAGTTKEAYVKIGNDNVVGNLLVDLSSASGIAIEDLRILIKTQELLEKDELYGSMYSESLNSHFGCCPLDLTLQDPQELFKTTITSNMQAIFQTSSTSGESSILGTIGANSTTQADPFVIVPETEFKEHGILMICAVHKLQNVYDCRYFKPKFINKQARFDFYTPELNDLGYQPVGDNEFLSYSGAGHTVGYNEAFAEYRYKFNKSHGSLNGASFAFWAPAIANEYGTITALYKEDPIILDKALSVRSTTAPQFFDAWGFEEECTKPMSLHSIPGFDGVI